MATGKGNGVSSNSCGKKEESGRDHKEMFQSMSQLEVAI